MPGKLRVVQGPDLGKEYPLPEGELSAGRDPEHAICLTDRSASRTHFLLRVTAGEARLVDMHSRNTTKVNGQPVAEHVLVVGDEIEVGRTRLQYSIDEPEPTHAGAPGGDAARPAGPCAGGDRLTGVAEAFAGVETMSGLAERLVGLVLSGTRAERAAVAWRGPDDRPPTPDAGRDAGGMPVSEWIDPDSAAGVLRSGGEGRRPGGEGRRILTLALPASGRTAGVVQAELPPDANEDPAVGALAELIRLAAARIEEVQALEASRREHARRAGIRRHEHAFTGDSLAAAETRLAVSRAAASDAPVLLTGEPGTGKRRVARAVHGGSARGDRPFVCVDCAETAPEPIADRLFGAGAEPGALERAQGGSLLVVHADRLPADAQARLVRALSSGSLPGPSGATPRRLDVRLLSTTVADLEAGVKAGRFRQDLYFRLSVVRLALPPLRERPEDVLVLARALLDELAAAAGRRSPALAPDAEAALAFSPWPGNVRELGEATARAFATGPADTLAAADFFPTVPPPSEPAS